MATVPAAAHDGQQEPADKVLLGKITTSHPVYSLAPIRPWFADLSQTGGLTTFFQDFVLLNLAAHQVKVLRWRRFLLLKNQQ